jgi:peroxiredoxin
VAARPVLSAPDTPAAKSVKPGDKAPDFTLRDTSGKTWQLSKLRGKAVLLDFGRVTCIACQGIAGELQRFNGAYAKQGLQILAINMDGAMAFMVPKFREERKLTFPFLLDRENKVPTEYGVETIPFLVLVGPDGKVKFTHVGYDPGFRKTVETAIRAALPTKKR